MIYADLHVHTTFSSDSTIPPKALVQQLVAHSFIKVAAVTDHDTVEACHVTKQLASAYPDILIIPGTEVSTPNGDIIVLGTEEMPPRPWTIENVIDFTRQRNCVSIVAHPYREYGMGDLAKNYRVDAIEVLNGCSSTAANEAAKKLAVFMGLPGVAGSDAHQVSELCTVHTEIQASMNADDIIRAVKKGSVSVSPINRSIHF